MNRSMIVLSLFVGISLLGGCAQKEKPQADAGKQAFVSNQGLEPAAFEAAAKEPGVILLDVRSPAEFAEGHIAGAMNIDVRSESFSQQVGKLDREKSVLIYCRSGNRTVTAGRILEQLNFKKYDYLKGGITQWIGQGKSVSTTAN